MPIVLLGSALLVVAALAAMTAVLLPLSLRARYRMGTAQRLARGWVATVNVVGMLISCAMFLTGAALSGFWVPSALRYSLIGLAIGALLGFVGLWLTRWERTPRGLLYRPNRWLVLGITVVVMGRILYGFWHGWHAWSDAPGTRSWLEASGAAGALGASATVIGYYLAYWAGMRGRLRREQR
jgi:hypothetical protein